MYICPQVGLTRVLKDLFRPFGRINISASSGHEVKVDINISASSGHEVKVGSVDLPTVWPDKGPKGPF